MASIEKRETKKGISYYVVYRANGKQRWKLAGKRRIDAERLRARIEHGLFTGTHLELPDITFSELATKWLELKQGQVRPKVYSSYRPHVRRLVGSFGDYKVKSIGPEIMEQFALKLYKEGLAPATAARCLTIAGSIFKKGMQWGYLARNPAQFVDKPRAQHKDIDFLEPEEIRRLIEASEEKYRCLLMFACFTGCRQSEILGLKCRALDMLMKLFGMFAHAQASRKPA